MTTYTWGRLLRRGAFLLAVTAAALAAVVPDWNARLKAEGYYGSVDLRLDLLPGGGPQAGKPFDLLLTASNAGPDDAHRPRVIATSRGDVNFTSSSGCTNDGAGFPQCWLPGPLAAGTHEDYLLHAQLSPTARGDIWFAAALTADDDELAPGDEIQIYRGTITAPADLRAQVACTRIVQRRTTCTYRFSNSGPAAAMTPSLSVSFYGAVLGVHWSCSAVRDGLCGQTWDSANSLGASPALVLPHDEIVYQAELQVDPDAVPNHDASLRVWAYISSGNGFGETDPDPSNNSAGLDIEVPLFNDGFEAPPSTKDAR